jgi:hypothetical protein
MFRCSSPESGSVLVLFNACLKPSSQKNNARHNRSPIIVPDSENPEQDVVPD